MTPPLRVLMIEDSEDDALLLLRVLHKGGVEPEWRRVQSREETEFALREEPWDVVVADFNLPAFDALEALELMRRLELDLPFIVVSGTSGEEAAVRTMRAGAHDYLVKDRLARLVPCIERELAEAGVRRQKREAEQGLKESHRRLEEAFVALSAAQERLISQERLRALGQMASGIAHDFNNSLAPILGFTEILLDRPELLSDREKTGEYLALILHAAQDAARVVTRLKGFYRSRWGEEPYQAVDLCRVLERVIDSTRFHWKDQALGRGLVYQLETRFAETHPVPCDEGQVRDAVANLIFNAVEAMPAGGTITLSLENRLGPGADPGVAVIVADTGVGMDEALRLRCLEPFVSTKGEHGTGLGLAVVYGVMKRHGGSVEITSEPGAGTRFHLWFPLGCPQGRGDPGCGGSEEPVALRPLRVLLAEDEPAVGRMLEEYLLLDGHWVDRVSNGQEALDRVEAGDVYDILIADRAMPLMNGDHLAIRVKALNPSLPVLMLTGFGDLMLQAGLMPEGVDRILGKPVGIATLRRAIAELIRAKE